jgi:AcrR family transcriptional regulator
MTSTAPHTDPVRRSARERLLEAADELFYAEGIQSVGIDRVIALAGVAKASLYNTFCSNGALVRAYLERRHEGTMSRLRRAAAAEHDPRSRILAVFDAQAEYFTEPGFRGCAFTAASAEAPAGGQVEEATDDYRQDLRTMFSELGATAGAPDPEALARQLHVIYDGAGMAARLDRDPAIARGARAAVAAVLAAALPVD